MTLLAPFLASSFLFGKVCAEASDCHYVVNSDLLIILKITTPRPTLGQWPLLSFLAGFLLRLLWAVAWSHDLFMSCHWLSRWRRRRRRRRPLHGGQTTHTLGPRRLRRASVGRSVPLPLWVSGIDLGRGMRRRAVLPTCSLLLIGVLWRAACRSCCVCDVFWRLFDVCFSSPNLSTVLVFSASAPARADSSVIGPIALCSSVWSAAWLLPWNNAIGLCLEIVGLCWEFLAELAIFLYHLRCF